MVPEIVADSKLNVTFQGDHVSHEVFDSGTDVRRRRKEERWQRHRYLGRGGYGTVWLEKCINDVVETRLRAVKNVPKTSYSAGAIDYTRELEAIAKFSQRKYDGLFVRSFGWFEDLESVYITMEYFELGDLQKHLSQPLPEPEAQHITYQLLEGLEHLHANGFAHRDLKPANVFVVQKRPRWWVKIGDFGISKRLHEDTAFRTVVGTVTHLAPEVLLNRFGGTGAYTHKVDMWSLGVMTHYILTKSLPFKSSSELSVYTRDNRLPTAALQSHCASAECQGFISSLLAVDPDVRLAAKDALGHDWIKAELELAPLSSSESNVTERRPNSLEGLATLEAGTSSPLPYGRWTSSKQSTADVQEPEAETSPELGQEGTTSQQQKQEQASTTPLPTTEEEIVTLQPQRTWLSIQRQLPGSTASQLFGTPDLKRRIIILGDNNCGRTSLLMASILHVFVLLRVGIPLRLSHRALVEGRFWAKEVGSIPPLGTYVAFTIVDDRRLELELQDTAGRADYLDDWSRFSPGVHVALLCFAIDEPQSLTSVTEQWTAHIRQLSRDAPIILVGCKRDLRHNRETIAKLQGSSRRPVAWEDGKRVGEEIGAYEYLECSALTNEGVPEVLEAAVRAALMEAPSPDDSKRRPSWWRRLGTSPWRAI
ncbi:uncharacterized protein DSM5745_05109 [Aspergillus mulundensis]|uniref:Serine/threonine-protein kinase ATG1 n=1 Tax=Aspergillus mulundensis TaxID=1810919 RepID=A0A3D8S5I2_9EURO|nr:hypothetical protein DSM5745_05109 [Aspergillus mulundensis]RDW81552.1 hypothetical protein DSM5745_05109 [Aspergillus mulundensis]